MKKQPEKKQDKQLLRKQIVETMRASFQIEGINISEAAAQAALKKAELKLGK